MKEPTYIPIIGLEIHVELNTVSKMFCGCRNDPFGAPKPNNYTCPVCFGLPGALPVPNKKAIDWTVMLGKALGCTISAQSKFDRKHYFYPDLPKGYQISQFDQPIATDGEMLIGPARKKEKKVRIRRVHLEEDTAKLLHRHDRGESVSLVDFNRSGVPLVEIVTEPDIHSPEEATWLAKEIYYQVKERLTISDADMEKGQMRLEANVSILKGPTLSTQGRTLKLPDYKVELKNINSFRFLEKAIRFELQRQMNILERGDSVHQETRGWDSKTGTTKPQRTKEEAADYRYFPEPDIPPLRLTHDYVQSIEKLMKPDDRVILRDISLPTAIQETVRTHPELINAILGLHQRFRETADKKKFVKILYWLQHNKDVWKLHISDIVEKFERETDIKTDVAQLTAWIETVVNGHIKACEDYQSGKEQALEFLIGQVQKLAKGKADVSKVKELLRDRLK